MLLNLNLYSEHYFNEFHKVCALHEQRAFELRSVRKLLHNRFPFLTLSYYLL